MKPPLDPERLLRVAKAPNQLIGGWLEGVSLEADSGETILDLCHRAASARLRLSYEMRRAGDACLAHTTPLPRSAISRYYYAMYHAMRATVYVFYDGDDHQEHTKLPRHIPDDFPTPGTWQTRLKNARYARNAADYDPYPKANLAWKYRAETIKRDADDLLAACTQYLRGKGCPGL